MLFEESSPFEEYRLTAIAQTNPLSVDAADGKQARAEMAAELRDLLSAPSPAGVDGLKRYEVFPYLDDEVAELDICESDDGTFVKYDDAQAIIDGLRGENERIRLNTAEYNEAISCYQSERDQQAQRIGELEGLLRATGEAGRQLSNAAYNLAQREGHELTKCECALLSSLRKQWDAALSAGKEGE